MQGDRKGPPLIACFSKEPQAVAGGPCLPGRPWALGFCLPARPASPAACAITVFCRVTKASPSTG